MSQKHDLGTTREDLDCLCTAKGCHTGNRGRIAHFIVAISFNKGVILCEQCFGKISGEMIADFIRKHFMMKNWSMYHYTMLLTPA